MYILKLGLFAEMNLVVKIRCFHKPSLYPILIASRKDYFSNSKD